MSERLIEKLDRFGVEAEIKEMTPEIRRFAMIVRNDMLQVWPKRDWVGLDLAEMDAIIDGNMTITDSKLRDAVYAVVIDTMTTLMEKNHG
jgi:hypothetical protein